MRASAHCRMRIRATERLRLSVYDDGGGVPTQGYGHTGPDVRFGGPDISVAQAEDWFNGDVLEAERAVDELVEVEVTQGIYDALVSFVYNIGHPAFSDSKVRRMLNAGLWCDAGEELARWNNDNGKPLQGLFRRRVEELTWYARDDWPRP